MPFCLYGQMAVAAAVGVLEGFSLAHRMSPDLQTPMDDSGWGPAACHEWPVAACVERSWIQHSCALHSAWMGCIRPRHQSLALPAHASAHQTIRSGRQQNPCLAYGTNMRGVLQPDATLNPKLEYYSCLARAARQMTGTTSIMAVLMMHTALYNLRPGGGGDQSNAVIIKHPESGCVVVRGNLAGRVWPICQRPAKKGTQKAHNDLSCSHGLCLDASFVL